MGVLVCSEPGGPPEWTDLELAPRIVAPYQKVEIDIIGQLHKGVKIRMAFHEDRAVGFMMYNDLWDCVLIVHAMYVSREAAKGG